jgi:hypothetical protein
MSTKSTPARLAAEKMNNLCKGPCRPPSEQSQRKALAIYSKLQLLDQSTRFDIVSTLHFLAHAEIDLELGKTA